MKPPPTKNRLSALKQKTDITLPDVRSDLLLKREYLFSAGLIFLYCLIYAVMRLSVSSTMELDESEQFLNGSFFSLGYAHQAPLYSWIVNGISVLCGMNMLTLVVAKYAILFFFYLSFYLIARSFWNMRQSLLVTGSLLLFPTYSYEFNRDLSHTILVTTMASVTSYFYIRLMQRKRTAEYALLGASIGLGLISKYNFAFFLAVLTLAASSFSEGRGVLLNKKILLSLAVCFVIVFPHALWLTQNNFLPLRHSSVKAEIGELQLTALKKVFSVIISSYSDVFAFPVAFAAFFGVHFARGTDCTRSRLGLFRYLALYGLIIPVPFIILLRAGHFSERWIAPLMFSLPLAVFSKIGDGWYTSRVKMFGYMCIFVAVSILLVRSVIGFFPDETGKVERIHTPFNSISQQLGKELRNRGIGQHITIVAENQFLGVNIMSRLPGSKLFSPDGRAGQDRVGAPGVIIWDVSEKGATIPAEFVREFPVAVPLGTFTAPYLHSNKFPPFVLGAALIR